VLALRRRLLGDSDTKTTTSLLELASAVHAQGDFRGAQPLLDEWVATMSRQRPETTEVRGRELIDLSAVYDVRGNAELAERLAREATDIYRSLFGERHPSYARSLVNLGTTIDRAGTEHEADSLLHHAVDLLREAYPGGHPELVYALKALGDVLDHEQRYVEAEPPLREAIAMARRFEGLDSPRVSELELDLALVLTSTGRYDEAAQVSQDAKQRLLKRYPPTNRLVHLSDLALGDALRGAGRYAQAESLLLSAFAAFESGRGFSRRPRESALSALVRLYDAEGRGDEAAKYAAMKRPPQR
jgi:hypothetical protein